MVEIKVQLQTTRQNFVKYRKPMEKVQDKHKHLSMQEFNVVVCADK